jgi:hypothetical protein
MIVTSCIQLPADLSALIYRKRYSVELFFHFFKQLLGMRHLLSRRGQGIDTQVYCAVIVCLLINLMTGKKPNRGMVSMIGFHLLGLATDQDVVNYLNQPDNTGVKLKAKEAIRKKMGSQAAGNLAPRRPAADAASPRPTPPTSPPVACSLSWATPEVHRLPAQMRPLRSPSGPSATKQNVRVTRRVRM